MLKRDIIIRTIDDVGLKYFEHCSFMELKEFIKKEFRCSDYLANQSARRVHKKMNGEKFLTRRSNPTTIKKNLKELLKIENIIFLRNFSESTSIYYGILKETTSDFFILEDGKKFERNKYFKTIKFS